MKRIHVDEIEFHLSYVNPEATADEISERFGVKPNSVYTALRRAGREDLRTRLHRNKSRVTAFGFWRGIRESPGAEKRNRKPYDQERSAS